MSKSVRINDLLQEIMGDRGVPRNIKSSIEESIGIMGGTESEEEKIASVISILDEASADPNITLHTRTRIWNMVSVLESIKSE
jgi:uncharacterized protein (UPF0147 family)